MASHSVAEAKNHLSELIDQALSGEEVVITRHGTPVAILKSVRQAQRPVTAEDIEWLRRRVVGAKTPAEDAGTIVSRARDEDWR
jgi:prevent-host-death family protein